MYCIFTTQGNSKSVLLFISTEMCVLWYLFEPYPITNFMNIIKSISRRWWCFTKFILMSYNTKLMIQSEWAAAVANYNFVNNQCITHFHFDVFCTSYKYTVISITTQEDDYTWVIVFPLHLYYFLNVFLFVFYFSSRTFSV